MLPSLLSYLDEASDNVYCFWLSRIDAGEFHDLDDALLLFPTRRPLSKQRMQTLAIIHSCWAALYRLSNDAADPALALDTSTLDSILGDMERVCQPLQPHPFRRMAMSTPLPRDFQTSSTIKQAAQLGKLEAVVWLHHVLPKYNQGECLRLAAYSNQHHVASWLLDHAPENVVPVIKYRDDPDLGIIAWRWRRAQSECNYVVATKWNVCLCRDGPCELADVATRNGARLGNIAAKHGDLEYARRLASHTVFHSCFSKRAAHDAAAGDHWDIVEYLLLHRPDVADVECVFTLQGSRRDISKLLVREGSLTDVVIKTKDVPVLRYFGAEYHAARRRGDRRHYQNVFARAIEHGQTGIAKWLVEHGPYQYSWPRSAADVAAEEGQLCIVQWLLCHRPNLVDPSNVFCQALRRGHVHIAKWLVEERLLHPEHLSYMEMWATKNQDDETLQWVLQASDLAVSENAACRYTLHDTAAAGDVVLAAWLVETQHHEVSSSDVWAAISSGNVDLVKWLARLSNDTSSSQNNAFLRESANHGNGELVRFFVEEFAAWDDDAFRAAMSRDNVQLMAYLYEVACQQPRAQRESPSRWLPVVRIVRISPRSLECLEWLLCHGFEKRLLWEVCIEQARIIEEPLRKTWLARDIKFHGGDDSVWLSERLQFRDIIGLVIQSYDPTFVCGVKWLPLWAIRVGRLELLQTP